MAIKNEDRVIRIKDYLQNSCAVRTYFLDTYGIDPLTPPPPQQGSNAPTQKWKRKSKNAFSKSEATSVKENYMLSRERVTYFIQLCSNPKVGLKPEFIFKGKGSRTHHTSPKGANY